MADRFEQLNDKLITFIENQHMFFVATAGKEGRVNLSPKGMDTLRVIDPHKIARLNLTGSGNETSTHVQENGRMTLMFCSFEKNPLILRVYGKAEVIHPRDKVWSKYAVNFESYTGARQVFVLDIDLVQTSCGFAVPFYEFKGDRLALDNWANKLGHDRLEGFRQEYNAVSLDGRPTNI